MYDELGCSCDTARTAKARMIGQAASLLRKQFVKRQSGGRVVLCDVLTNLLPIGTRRACPNQPHSLTPDILRRVSARQAAASASTSSAEITLPVLAESKPAWT